MDSPRKVADALGRPEMAARLGVGLTAISTAIGEGAFRPAWYKTIRDMGVEMGVEISDSLFNWKAAQ